MPTSLFFDGLRTPIPGAYSKNDLTGLETAGLGGSGIVAAIGTAKGGIPYTAIAQPETDLQEATDDGQARDFFREGVLRDVPPFLFNPSKDDEIGGAQKVVFVKVNPAAASAQTFANLSGDALILTSADYGVHTTQISVEIGPGTVAGKLLTIRFEAILETLDNLGAAGKFSVLYDGGSDGADTASMAVALTGSTLAMTRDDLGQDALVTTPISAAGHANVISTDAGDTMVATIYGLDATNAPQTEEITLTGLVKAVGLLTWNLVTGVVLATAALGVVTVADEDNVDAVIFDVPIATLQEGFVSLDIPVASTTVDLVSSGASVKRVVLRGLSLTNVAQVELVTLTGVVPVTTTASWKRLTSIEMAEVETAQTITTSGIMILAPAASVPTLQALKDLISSEADFTFIALVGNLTTFAVTDLDVAAATSILTTATFYAVLYDVVTAVNANSQLVTAAAAAGADGAPNDTTAPVYLTGGNEGDATPGNEGVITATQSDWQAAIDLLKQRGDVNSIWPGTGDAAVHASVEAHCAYMGGVGRAERDTFLGATADETKAQLLARGTALNSRHCRLVGQEVRQFNSAGVAVWWPPLYLAAAMAGMQAGSPVGTPLTHKILNVLGIRQASGWNPADDAADLIYGGVVSCESISGKGIRVIRNITTYLVDDNPIYSEGSANEAANFGAKEFRDRMETLIGKAGFSGSALTARGLARGVLKDLTDENIYTAWRSLKVDLVGDALVTRYEAAPITPINFAPVTIHLVTTRQSA